MEKLWTPKDGTIDLLQDGADKYIKVKSGMGYPALYPLHEVKIEKPIEAVLMDLDGTSVKSEEFWVWIIQSTIARLMGKPNFTFEDADIPHVSGHSVSEHLTYCINKYFPDKELSEANAIYHKVAKAELDAILNGGGRSDDFKPTKGLKEFLLEVKRRGIKIGLVTSGLDYKAIPEIVAVFRTLDMGDPLKFYDAIITGGHRKDTHEYGTLGEIAAKPHPWVYTEVAYIGLKVKDPSKVLGIEDSAAGVLALRFAGFPVIGVQEGNIAKSGLDCLCCKKVDDLRELIDLL
jgi:beta-phosphoglucomutase-like phosphatase (HAD superfamily)